MILKPLIACGVVEGLYGQFTCIAANLFNLLLPEISNIPCGDLFRDQAFPCPDFFMYLIYIRLYVLVKIVFDFVLFRPFV